MTRALSNDLRAGVVAMTRAGHSCRAAAQHFGVSVASVVRWSRLTGPAAALPRRRLVLLPQRDWVLARIAVAPDLTVRALRAELVAGGVRVSYGAVWRFLAAERLTCKKRCTPPNRTDLTWPASGRAGSVIGSGSTQVARCSLMKPGARRT